MLEARSLTKYYSAVPAVRDLSFKLAAGGILGLLGPNGSGKSTTVSILTGLLEPSGGTVLLDGQPVRDDLLAYKARIGYVPEEAVLYTYLTGPEYLSLVGGLRGIPQKRLQEKIDGFLTLFGLQDDVHAPMSAYSKGMRQKILIAAALLHDPAIIVLDEPNSGLDVTTALVLRRLVQRLAAEGRMVVYYSVTQNPIGGLFAVARTDGDPGAISGSVVRAIHSMDANVAIYDVATMEERVFRSLARQRFAMVMLTVFAGFALVLAAVGIYSVMSYLVSQGTRDIGIRMALGAERSAVLRMIFGHGLVLTVGGVIVGLIGAFALTRVMRTLLFEVSASDPMTFAAVPIVLTAAALAASYIPARRATRIEPLEALRDE